MQDKVAEKKAPGLLSFGGSLMDDIVAKQVFRHPEAVHAVLKAVYPGKDIQVDKDHVWTGLEVREGADPEGLRFDVLAVDSKGNGYDIEIGKVVCPDFERRCRRRLGALHVTVQGLEALDEKLVKVAAIFLFPNDPFGEGTPLYRAGCRIDTAEGCAPFDDGTEAILVNGAYRKPGTAIGDLNRDLGREDLEEIANEGLRAAVRKAG